MVSFYTGIKTPRNDHRKKQLKADILKSLKQVSTFSGFQNRMEALGYQVIKGRGISFIDSKKVRTKGSEVGLSLGTINKILGLQNKIKMESLGQMNSGLLLTGSPAVRETPAPVSAQKTEESSVLDALVHELGLLFSEVMKSEAAYYGESYPSLYTPKKKRKKRKELHL